jgi:hypothetical protein
MPEKSDINPSGSYSQFVRYLALGIVVIMLLIFIFRTPLAGWYIHHRINQFNRTNHATLKISGLRIHGFASILVTGITLKPDKGDTLLKVDSVFASVSILKIIAGRIVLHDIRLINTGFYFMEPAKLAAQRMAPLIFLPL